MRCEQILKLLAIHFAHVVLVRIMLLIGINRPIGGRQDQASVGRQYPAEFRQHGILLGKMLDGFKRYNQVNGRILKRQRSHGRGKKPEIGHLAVARFSMGDGNRIEISANHLAGRARDKRASISFSAGSVKDTFATSQLGYKKIPMPVLMPNPPLALGCKALTRKRQGFLVCHRMARA